MREQGVDPSPPLHLLSWNSWEEGGCRAKRIEHGSHGTTAARPAVLLSLLSGLEMGQAAAKSKLYETPLRNLGLMSPTFRFTDK